MVQPLPEDRRRTPTPDVALVGTDEVLRIPEIEEVADISTRVVESGTVRITKEVHTVERDLATTLHNEVLQIDRKPINRLVKNAPPVRMEGDTTVFPVVEEVMVKVLLLKEEVRVTRQKVEKPSAPQHVTLRREEVKVERGPASAGGPSEAAIPPEPRASQTPESDSV